jgi:anti-anti-sigma factor
MNFTAEQEGQVTIVSVSGSVDGLTAPALTGFLTKHLGEHRSNIVVNLHEVDYISSAGLRALLGALKESRQQGGDLRLAAVQENVRKVLNLSGFTSILKLYPDVLAAVGSFKA